jgi:hypothetical protein
MVFCQRMLAIGGAWLLATTVPYAAQAQKHGGVLQVYTVAREVRGCGRF